MLTMTSGCEAIGVLINRTQPPVKIPPRFDLEGRTVSVVVVSDDTMADEDLMLEADAVAIAMEQGLAEFYAIDPDARGEWDVVVNLDASREQEILGGRTAPSSASARIRVVDEAGQELWPADGSRGWHVTASVPVAAQGSAQDLRRAALIELGQKAARLFYAHVPQP
jgi:hypothetical protein